MLLKNLVSITCLKLVLMFGVQYSPLFFLNMKYLLICIWIRKEKNNFLFIPSFIPIYSQEYFATHFYKLLSCIDNIIWFVYLTDILYINLCTALLSISSVKINILVLRKIQFCTFHFIIPLILNIIISYKIYPSL